MALYIGSEKVDVKSGTVLSSHTDATITPDKVLNGEIGYGPEGKVVGSIPIKDAASYTPGNNAQTIDSGQYLGGVQTINPVPTETKTVTAGTSAIDVTPSSGKYLSKVTVNPMAYNAYYTGSSAPSASLGSDGDLYLKI